MGYVAPARQRQRIGERALPTPVANGASPSGQTRSGSRPPSAAGFPYCTRDTAHPRRRSCRHGRHPTACRDDPRRPRRNPRRENISSIALPACPSLFFPVEIRTDIGASLAACLAGKLCLNVGQSDVIRPSIAGDRCRMAAAIIRAIDQETTHAGSAHFGEGDLLRAAIVREGGHPTAYSASGT
jgi:hypothetical protein